MPSKKNTKAAATATEENVEEVLKEIPEVEENITAEMLKEQELKQVFEALAKVPGAPTREQYNSWMEEYQGGIYLTVYSPSEIFFFRTLKWFEYKDIKRIAADHDDPNAFFDEMLLERCVIWPALPASNLGAIAAGTIPTLSAQIQRASNFMSEAEAYSIVISPN